MFGSLLSQNKMGTEFTPLESCPNPKLELFVLFWVAERQNINDYSWEMFEKTSLTRINNIKNSSWYDAKIHKVYSVPITSFDQIEEHIKKLTNVHGGKEKIKTREVGIFSHAGPVDGPIAYNANHKNPVSEEEVGQMAIIGGWDAIDFNWKINKTNSFMQDPLFIAYGCRTGSKKHYSFAEKISKLNNFKDVLVGGQGTYSYPSDSPRERLVSIQRYVSLWKDQDPAYMIGSIGFTGPLALTECCNIKAQDMNFFKNGVFQFQDTQEWFNTHEKK